jgi:hypothetical protein
MTLEDFNLDVNPYDYLEIERGCRDIKEIKRAYRRKSLLMHPDKNNGKPADFSVLNKCFVYLKTLCEELAGKGTEHMYDLDERIRALKGMRNMEQPAGGALSTEIPDIAGSHFSGGFSGASGMQGGMQAGMQGMQGMQGGMQGMQTGIATGGRKIDFEKQLRHDNSVIGAEDFDADRCLQDMMQHRPTSTRYHNLEQPSIQNPFLGKQFTIDKFNTYFDTRKANGDFQNQFGDIDGFCSFDDGGNIASVVSDGNFMFVQGSSREEEAGSSSTIGFNLLAECAYDRNFEKERYSRFKNGEKVSAQDEQKFKKMYHASIPGGEAKQKLSKNEFKERMLFMEAQHVDKLEDEKRKQRVLIGKQMEKLTDITLAKLRRNLQVTHGGIPP